MAFGMPTLVVGNITADVTLQHSQNGGKPFVRLTIANTPRVKNRETNQYEDGPASFIGVTLYDQMAENVAATVGKGTRVIAYGELEKRTWTDKENNPRESLQLENVTAFGVDLRFATAQIHRAGQGGAAQAQPQQNAYAPQQGAPAYGPPQGQQPMQQPQQGGYPVPPQPLGAPFQQQGAPAPQGEPVQQGAPVQQQPYYPAQGGQPQQWGDGTAFADDTPF